MFFIGYEQGPAYAGASAVYTLSGLAALLCFLFVYYLISARIKRRAWSILAASAAANLTFFAVDLLLHALNLPAWACLPVGAASILGFGALFRRIPEAEIVERVRLAPVVLLLRAVIAALVILAITGAAELVPPAWAGLFSIYPANLFPLLLIVHSTYGPVPAHAVIKHLPTGLWALALYALTISTAYPRLGIYWGTLAGFAVATTYLLVFAAWNRQNNQRKSAATG